MREHVEAAIRRHKVVAIMRGVPPHVVAEVGEALLSGGIPVMEVALSTADGLQSLQRLRSAVDGRGLVGAGTVVTPELARAAVRAGAQFFVTPHLVPEVCQIAQREGLAVICGALTPTEIAQARELGSGIVKLFPASTFGPGYVRALKGPYPDLELLPTGGVGPGNLAEYLKAGAVGAGIGGALTEQDWSQPDMDRVSRLAAELSAIASGG